MKNVLLADEPRSVRRKLREIVLAHRVEAALSKDRSLELYLNEIYFGDGAIGLAAAAERYFGVTAAELSVAQAAVLAAMPPAPNALRIDRPENAERALARRDWVLVRMETEGYLTAATLAAARDAPLL